MKIGRVRQAFLDRFLDNELTPLEELFVICNAYRHSKTLRVSAVLSDIDPRLRHTVARDFNLARRQPFDYQRHIRGLEQRKDEDFGTRLREFYYTLLYRADKFPSKGDKTV